MGNIEFVSYNGEWPCLCHGTLKIKVNGELYILEHALSSGGRICSSEDWSNMWAEQGPWSIDLDEYPELEQYREEIEDVVNCHVEQGCCGGCI